MNGSPSILHHERKIYTTAAEVLRRDGLSLTRIARLIICLAAAVAVVIATIMYAGPDTKGTWGAWTACCVAYFIITCLLLPDAYCMHSSNSFRSELSRYGYAHWLVTGRNEHGPDLLHDKNPVGKPVSVQAAGRNLSSLLRKAAMYPRCYTSAGPATPFCLLMERLSGSASVVLTTIISGLVIAVLIIPIARYDIACVAALGLLVNVSVIQFLYRRGRNQVTLADYLLKADCCEAETESGGAWQPIVFPLGLLLDQCQFDIAAQNRRSFTEIKLEAGALLLCILVAVLGGLDSCGVLDRLEAGMPSGLSGFGTGGLFLAALFLLRHVFHLPFVMLYRRQAEAVRQRLSESDISVMLVNDVNCPDQLRAAVPERLAWLLDWPRKSICCCTDLASRIWLAAYNLDWYLNPRKRLVRPHWYVVVLQPLLLLTMVFAAFKLAESAPYIAVPCLLLIAAMFTAMTVIKTNHLIERSAWSIELIRHLQRELAGDYSSEQYRRIPKELYL